jgi:DNA modification methylase
MDVPRAWQLGNTRCKISRELAPYILRNLLLRYSAECDPVLGRFVGGGTTLVEAKLLNRNILGADINPIAIERYHEKTRLAI